MIFLKLPYPLFICFSLPVLYESLHIVQRVHLRELQVALGVLYLEVVRTESLDLLAMALKRIFASLPFFSVFEFPMRTLQGIFLKRRQ